MRGVATPDARGVARERFDAVLELLGHE